MKNINFKNTILIVSIFLTIVSCQNIEDYNDGWEAHDVSVGAPEILGITPVNAEQQLIAGSPAQLIAIHGKNLVGATSIEFDDVTANISAAFVKENQIVLRIPDALPDNITNTLTITTNKGVATYSFEILVPALEISGLYNEYTIPGDTAVITGKYFDVYKLTPERGKIYFGNEVLPIAKADAQNIKFIVPASVTFDEVVKIGSDYAKIQTPVQIPGLYKETGFKLIDFDNPTTYNSYFAGSTYITDGTKTGDPKPLVSKFTRFTGTFAASSYTSIFAGYVTLNVQDIVTNKSKYKVEFEINTKSLNPLSGGNIVLKFANGTYNWNPASSGIALNTYGQWKTVSLDLDLFTACAPIIGKNNVSLASQPKVATTFDVSFANFRIVKK